MTPKDIVLFFAMFLFILLGTWVFKPITSDDVIFSSLWASLWTVVNAIRETRGSDR